MMNYVYKSYSEYIETQRTTILRTKRGSNKLGRYQEIYKDIMNWYPDFRSMISVGTRSKKELEVFLNNCKDKDIIGIDLFDNDRIINCDMSKIYDHDYFRGKRYDLMMSIHSLEHCLDFNGLLKGIDYLKIKHIIVELPLKGKINFWDCVLYDFQSDPSEENIIKSFPNFKVDFMKTVGRRHKSLYFGITRLS